MVIPAISADEQLHLLNLARRTAVEVLSSGRAKPIHPRTIRGVFGGAFVTFWGEGKKLRGCVGSLSPTDRVEKTVQDATQSALRDSRFVSDPITLSELESLCIEVSVLSGLSAALEPAGLTPGLHGVLIRRGSQSGCFLPKVATENGWSAEEFLTQCCVLKAGMPGTAWREPSTEVFLFTADAIRENRTSLLE